MNPSRTILLCAILLTACATSAEGPWNVALTSSGGIAGRGNGGIVVDDAGTVAITLQDGKQCEYDGFDDALDEAIAKAQPRRWADRYEGPCADCFDWTMTLTRGDKTYTTSWNDVAGDRPRDLVRVDEVLRAIKRDYSERCR